MIKTCYNIYISLLFALLISGSAGLHAQNYDTVSQLIPGGKEPNYDSALVELKVLDPELKPLRGIPLYLVDEQQQLVYKSNTDVYGIALFLLPVSKTYLIDIHKTKEYSEIVLPDYAFMHKSKTLTYNPGFFSQVPEKNKPAPQDTLYQDYESIPRPKKHYSALTVFVQDGDENPVANTRFYLLDHIHEKCYAGLTNELGEEYFLLPHNNTYQVNFEDFENLHSIKLPDVEWLRMKQTLSYIPTVIREENHNDTIIQFFDRQPSPATARALVEVEVMSFEDDPLVNYPVLINDTESDTVYVSYSDEQGKASFLLPKGYNYRLSFFKETFSEKLFFPMRPGLRKAEIQYKTSGLILDEDNYQRVSKVQPLPEEAFEKLPKSLSNKAYCPPVEDQGLFGTCVGWAASYYAFGMQYFMEDSLLNRSLDQNHFSPGWIYEQIKFSYDRDCVVGSSIERALGIMKTKGNLPLPLLEEECNPVIRTHHRDSAAKYKIHDYRRLFDWGADDKTKVNTIKKSIAEHKAVVVGFKVPPSFHDAGSIWKPANEDYFSSSVSGHAMVVVAYNDEIGEEGAFLLVNSWGRNWGNNGYSWVEYDDFVFYCRSAFEMFSSTSPRLAKGTSGNISFLQSGSDSELDIDDFSFEEDNVASYKMKKGQLRDSLELLLSLKGKAYLNVLTLNEDDMIYRLFPRQGSPLSSFLGYSDNMMKLTLAKTTSFKKLIFIFTEDEIDLSQDIQDLNQKLNITNKWIFIQFRDWLKTGLNFDPKKVAFKLDEESDGEMVVFTVEL
ncbi:MAG: C1 family peptidase [Bacteroidales bacterium]|nr:C1 family peptidase [Bacteroidales bacterium]MCF8351356.1 C1 family peptidase [Bacteroidales bacterium]MCF8377642.1 C1 family peptidase [Bacteroidales bacterium]